MERPVPQNVRPLNITGRISFNCCGQQHLTADAIEATTVRCPFCGISYQLGLTPIPFSAINPWSAGTLVRLKTDVTAWAGQIQYLLAKDTQYRTTDDLYGVLNLQDDEVAVLSPQPVKGKLDRHLVFAVKVNDLEIIEEVSNE